MTPSGMSAVVRLDRIRPVSASTVQISPASRIGWVQPPTGVTWASHARNRSDAARTMAWSRAVTGRNGRAVHIGSAHG